MDGRFVQPDGEKIRRRRREHSWSQERLAETAGLRKRTVQRAEAGARVQRSTLRALAQALGCPPNALARTGFPIAPPQERRTAPAPNSGKRLPIPTRTDASVQALRERHPAEHHEGDAEIRPGTDGAVARSIQVDPPLIPAPVQAMERVAHSTPQTPPEAELRQLTVLFCDLVDSTALATRLAPEDLLEIVQAYQAACTEVIQHFDGYMAQYLGDGILAYFGYPYAHEDDAQRAVHAGLGIVQAIARLNADLDPDKAVRLRVRLGIHTGLVVVGMMARGARREPLALGEPLNTAARLQQLAIPDTVAISATTYHLIRGFFECKDLGAHRVKGIAAPLQVYGVLRASGVQRRFDLAVATGLTPLVDREQELALLLEHWERAKGGSGQVVVLRGEAGIGKSRLVRAMQERLAGEPYMRLEFRCSSYAQHSALYPVIELGRRLLQWQRDEAPEVTLSKMEAALASYNVSLPEVVPLLAPLLSLPLPERYARLQLTPQRQKQKTLEVILALLLAHAAQQPVLFIVEDLHWVDPSTLELLTLLIDQEPTARILALLTGRLEFRTPWGFREHVTALTLDRLPPMQVERMIDRMTGGKRLPAEVRQQLVAKTDGVPLFVEELTKMVLESGQLREQITHYELLGPLHSLAIPTTLHDSLMARLDRLGGAKEVAQLGATIARAFPYELLKEVSPWDEERLQEALAQLVAAELLYQRDVPPRVTYAFKHALIQEAAYQSLLKSKRQQYHQQTVHVLEQHFPEIATTQPELLAYHYTEAGLPAQAIPYWQRAGELAVERSANVEAISHFTKGLELLRSLPATPERTRQELALQLALGPALRMIKGHTAPEVEGVYTRAYELSQQLGDSRQQFSALVSLSRLYLNRAMILKARELAEHCLTLAQQIHDPGLLQDAHRMLGWISFFHGEPVLARAHLEQGIAYYEAQRGHLGPFSGGMDPAVACLSILAWTLWQLGYPEQALTKSQEALTLAQKSSHAYSLGLALQHAALLHQSRREAQRVQEVAEVTLRLAREQGFVQWLAGGMVVRGWALAEQGSTEEGIDQLRQGMVTWQLLGTKLGHTHTLFRLAQAYGKGGQTEEGLRVLDEALAITHERDERHYETEIYRLKGEFLLAHESDWRKVEEAEECLRQAFTLACQRQAKSFELRAAVSLSRLWKQQGKHIEAQQLLAEIYDWFREGFDTPDLQETKELLDTLM